MKVSDAIKSDAFKGYFGEHKNRIRWEGWLKAFSAITEKAGVGQLEANRSEAMAGIGKTWSWSWLGLFFSVYWLAFHGARVWFFLVGCLVLLILAPLMGFGAGGLMGGYIGLALFSALLGKSMVLSAKLLELDKTGKLAPPSWLRLVAVILIVLFCQMVVVGQETPQSFARQGEAYPEHVVQNFIGACVNNPGATYAGCSCIIGEIQARLPLADYAAYELALSTGQGANRDTMAAIGEAVAACLDAVP